MSTNPAGPRAGVVVLGMSRSGTSAVTRMFVRAGFFVGREGDVLPANEFNPTGHHENLGIFRADERVLGSLGATWFDPPPRRTQVAARRWAVSALREEVQRMLREANNKPIAVKDPRIGVLLPIWEPVLEEYLHPVLVIREPIEIARSLSRRDGTPLAFGLAAWELHTNELLRYLHGRLVTVAPYARLLDEPQLAPEIVRQAAAHIDPARKARLRPGRASAALEAELRRERGKPRDQKELLTARQRELWLRLRSMPPGGQRIDVPRWARTVTANARAAVRAESERVGSEWHRSLLTDELTTERAKTAGLATELERERARTAELAAELERLGGDAPPRRRGRRASQGPDTVIPAP